MKKFGLGLLAGSTAGIILSLIKNKNGKRLGEPVKREINGFYDDAAELITNVQQFNTNRQKFTHELPQVQKTVTAISSDIHHYQKEAEHSVGELKTRINKFSTD